MEYIDIDDIKDCKRIQQILLDHGYEASLKECQKLWQKRSDDWCAGWLILPDSDDEIWSDLESVVESKVL
jgi:hypothetical protein